MEFSNDHHAPSFSGPLFGADEFPELAHPQSIATDGATWAVTLAHSYGVYFLG